MATIKRTSKLWWRRKGACHGRKPCKGHIKSGFKRAKHARHLR